MIFPRLMRSIFNLYMGTNFGKVAIYMQNGRVTTIESIESDKIEEEAVVEK